MSQSNTSFHSLPAEITMKIIEKLDEKDRKSIASLNKRFFNLDMMTGHRRFDLVEFKPKHGCCFEIECGNKFQKFNQFTPIDGLSTFFNYATTKRLKINGLLDVMSERMLLSVFKNIQIDKLIIEIGNDTSHRQRCDRAVEVFIRWKIAETTTGIAKKMILSLPDIVKQRITAFISHESFIDDQIFLNLIRKSSGTIVIDCPKSAITKAALATAFEIVKSGATKKEVHCCVNERAFFRFFEELFVHHIHDYEYNPVDLVFKDIDSGATACFYPDDDDRKIIEMHPPQK